MKLLISAFVFILLLGCGPSEGDKFIDPETGETVTAYTIGSYEKLEDIQELTSTSKQDGSISNPEVKIESANVISSSDSSNLILAGWRTQKSEKHIWHLKIFDEELLVKR